MRMAPAGMFGNDKPQELLIGKAFENRPHLRSISIQVMKKRYP